MSSVNLSELPPDVRETKTFKKSDKMSEFSGLDFATMSDDSLRGYWKDAAPVLKGAYETACFFLCEVRTRYHLAKQRGEKFWGYSNFDRLCDEQLDWSSKQVRRLTNNAVPPATRKSKSHVSEADLAEYEASHHKEVRKSASNMLADRMTLADVIGALIGMDIPKPMAEAAVRIIAGSQPTPADAIPQILNFIDGAVVDMTQADKKIVYESLKAQIEERLAVAQ